MAGGDSHIRIYNNSGWFGMGLARVLDAHSWPQGELTHAVEVQRTNGRNQRVYMTEKGAHAYNEWKSSSSTKFMAVHKDVEKRYFLFWDYEANNLPWGEPEQNVGDPLKRNGS